jgi:hypothetical protein
MLLLNIVDKAEVYGGWNIWSSMYGKMEIRKKGPSPVFLF